MFVILDRDGVINEESSAYIKSPQEWHPITGSLEAIAKLKHAGVIVVVATNQSGIARGLYSEKTLQQIHLTMTKALQKHGVCLDGIFYCPHHPDEYCACRKPAPGMFLMIAKKFDVDLREVICIGDSLRDIKAAQAVGSQPVLVLTGNGQATRAELGDLQIPIYENLAQAVSAILKNAKL